jgi:hypothetical protein
MAARGREIPGARGEQSMHPTDEFFSFTTPNKGFRYSNYGKVILVTVQSRAIGLRVVQVHLIAQTSVKMLAASGAYHIDSGKLPEHVRQSILDYQDAHLKTCMERVWADMEAALRQPTERLIQ